MRLEDYLEFEKTDQYEYIHVKGTRVGIDVILAEFHKGTAPDEIQRCYPAVTLEQVYGTITYYLHNRKEVDTYLQRDREAREAAYQEWLKTHTPSPLEERLRERRAQAKASKERARP
jgi:uncharacterized protein (DUF433 family)